MRAKLLILVILVGIIGFVGYRFMSKPKTSGEPVVETQLPPEHPPVTPEVVETKVVRKNTPTTTTKTNMASTVPPEGAPDWKAKLDSILGSNANVQQKQQQLKEFLSSLPDPSAEQAVQALTVSVKNESFGFIKPLVVDPNLPEPVRDEFMVDVLNRPNSIRVPLFLELARNPDHPDNENAYDMLEIFTSQKLGADWGAWDKAVATWLKENPDDQKRPKNFPAEPVAQ